jgi:hypothetical protein
LGSEVDHDRVAAGQGTGGRGARREQNGLGIGVADDMLQLARARPRVDRDRRDTRAQGADHRHTGLDPRLGEHGNPLAAGHGGGHASTRLGELGIAEHAPREAQRRPVVRILQGLEHRPGQ